jgi:hypothetical protein
MGNVDGYRYDGVGEVNDLFRGAFDDLTGTLVKMFLVVALVQVAVAATPRRFRPLTKIAGLVVTAVAFVTILR